MRLRFTKMHGLGNDFVVLDARATPLPVEPSLARALADRRNARQCGGMGHLWFHRAELALCDWMNRACERRLASA